VPPPAPRGRTRETNLGDVVDSIFYMAQSGCQWHLLPKDFPPYMRPKKKIKGRKRHILTDTIGRRVGMIVHPANVQDRDGAPDLLASLRNAFPWLRHVFADGGYASVKLMSRPSGGRLSAIMEPILTQN
jgi:transposase